MVMLTSMLKKNTEAVLNFLENLINGFLKFFFIFLRSILGGVVLRVFFSKSKI